MRWIREYPRAKVRHHLYGGPPRFGVSEVTVALTPIAVRRPPHGAKRATVECHECGTELDVRVYSARFTRVAKVLLLLLGIGAATAAVAFFLHTPIATEYETTAEYDAAWAPILGLCVSAGLMVGAFVTYYIVDGVWLSRCDVLHRLTY